MKHIRIKNQGVISPQAIHLLGASTKRNDQSKIGQFGTGNKYALAYLLRNGYDVKIYAGLEEIVITTKPEEFRGESFEVIYVNSERTSITLTMGKDWAFWQAIRELYCNAIDEGSHSLDFVSSIEPREGETHFYIDTKKDVTEFVTNFDNYFATSKKVLFECKDGRILEKTGTTANIYRKGVKCFISNKTSVFDYDFNEIDIDENRLVKYTWEVEEKIWRMLYQCDNTAIIMSVMRNSADHAYLEGCLSDYSTINASMISDTFKDCLKHNRFAPLGASGLLQPDEREQHIIVPTKVFKAVRSHIPEENVGAMFRTTLRGDMYREIEATELQKATIEKALEFLAECGFDMPYKIKVAMFDEKEIWGAAIGDEVFLSDVGLDRGVNDTVIVLVEEFVHIKHKVQDFTRGFQTAIIAELVNYMKQRNAYLI